MFMPTQTGQSGAAMPYRWRARPGETKSDAQKLPPTAERSIRGLLVSLRETRGGFFRWKGPVAARSPQMERGCLRRKVARSFGHRAPAGTGQRQGAGSSFVVPAAVEA